MAPIISTESPFRRMPVDMPHRQILYLDALRLSAEMAALAYDDFHSMLLGMRDRREGPLGARAVRAILNAYSIIDAVHRFRELLRVTPGLKHNTAFELFMRQTNDVKELRNIVQHLNNQVDRIAQEGWAALGTLTWLGPSAASGGPPTLYILQPGTFYAGQWTYGPLVDFYSSLADGEIADISLATAGFKVNLSMIMDKLRSIIRSIEGALVDFAADKEHFGSDILFTIALTPVEETGENHDPKAS